MCLASVTSNELPNEISSLLRHIFHCPVHFGKPGNISNIGTKVSVLAPINIEESFHL